MASTLEARLVALAGRIRDQFNTIVPRMVPAGGLTGTVLGKLSLGDYDIGWLSLRYDIAVTVVGKPGSGERLVDLVAAAPFSIAAALAGTRVRARTPAAADATLSVRVNSTEIGVITLAAGATSGTLTGATSPTTLVAGDVLEVIAPSPQDAALADLSITIAGTR